MFTSPLSTFANAGQPESVLKLNLNRSFSPRAHKPQYSETDEPNTISAESVRYKRANHTLVAALCFVCESRPPMRLC